jgi:hypothetical protein
MTHRTTIVLPPRTKELAATHARQQGISFSEFVRRAVEQAVSSTHDQKRPSRDPFFSDRAVFRGPAPSDTSERHDAYLYGETDAK